MTTWTDVNDAVPAHSDFVWVKRLSSAVPELAFYSPSDDPDCRFHNAGSAGDSEGLSIEYYTDVVYWAELKIPEFYDSPLSKAWPTKPTLQKTR
jgi:hypothetical protein